MSTAKPIFMAILAMASSIAFAANKPQAPEFPAVPGVFVMVSIEFESKTRLSDADVIERVKSPQAGDHIEVSAPQMLTPSLPARFDGIRRVKAPRQVVTEGKGKKQKIVRVSGETLPVGLVFAAGVLDIERRQVSVDFRAHLQVGTTELVQYEYPVIQTTSTVALADFGHNDFAFLHGPNWGFGGANTCTAVVVYWKR